MIKTCPILIPKKEVDYTKFAVVACDQFSGNQKYWNDVESQAEGVPSAYHLILPELYLTGDFSKRLDAINVNITNYLNQGIFDTVESGMILTRRYTPYSSPRTGIVTSIDLECYSFNLADKALVRATEGTILDRLPPRVKIRSGASLELPHIMLLINDPNKTVIEKIDISKQKKLYDFELNMKGGHLEGYEILDTKSVIDSLNSLKTADNMLFLVGDGNHSLAAAKALWDRIKADLSESERLDHPARFALVEICNIYDEGINFHPIHRVLTEVDVEDFLQGLNKKLDKISGLKREEKSDNMLVLSGDINTVLAVSVVQEYMDTYLVNNPDVKAEYIHGEEELSNICKALPTSSVGIFLPSMAKNELFEYIAKGSLLPKKTFSMGEGSEKRYYFEARKLK